VLVDGKPVRTLGLPHTAVVGGDGACYAVACASVVAKEARDRLMRALAARHPAYAWERNAGYGTPAHRAAVAAHGLTPHHRRSFCGAIATGPAEALSPRPAEPPMSDAPPAADAAPSIFRPGLLDGQVALVTGGGTGIGLGVAEELGRLGAHVVLASRKPENLEAGVRRLEALGARASAVAVDVRDPSACGRWSSRS
jgi:hypothetical protein